jgi:hypothetical protein
MHVNSCKWRMVVCWNVGIEVGMAFKSLYIRVLGEWKVRLESNTLNIILFYVRSQRMAIS